MSNQENAPVTLTAAEKEKLVRSTRRTDLRNIIGLLFVIYGVLVTAVGIIDPAADVEKTGGIHINLWTGISMLVVGILFFIWGKLAPVPEEDILNNALSVNEKIAEAEAGATALKA